MPNLDERTKAAFDHARSATGLVVTLSTGFIGLSISFSKDVIKTLGDAPMGLMAWGFYCLAIAAVSGAWCHLAMTGTLAGGPKGDDPASVSHKNIYAGNIRVPALIQVIAFCIGIALVVAGAAYGVGAAP
jgi:hypothetical protein